jgi:predicted MFS family arabinose efflux permease
MRPPGHRGTAGIAAVLTLAMACATFLGAALSVLAPFLVEDLDISRAELGWLFTAFGGVGAAASVTAGQATDRVGGRRVLDGLFAVAALCVVGAAAAPSYAWLAVAVLVGGLGNAAGNPATNKLIALHAPPGRRGVITGVKQSGVAVSMFLAGALLPLGAVALGWRPALALTALVPLAGMLAAARVVPGDPPEPRTRGGRRPRVRVRQPAAIRWIAAYGVLMGAGGGAIYSYLPLYAYEEVGLSATAAGVAAAVLGFVAIVARFLWSWRTEHVTDFAVPLGALALASVAASLAIWGAATGGPWLLWVGAVAAGASVAAWNTVGMLAVIVLADAANAGRASGLVLLGFLGGYTVSPVLFGYAADRTGGYGLGWGATTAVLAAAVLVTWLWRRSARAAGPDDARPTTPASPRRRDRRAREG